MIDTIEVVHVLKAAGALLQSCSKQMDNVPRAQAMYQQGADCLAAAAELRADIMPAKS